MAVHPAPGTVEAPALAEAVRLVLMKGNEAMAEAAIQAGCDAYFGYPITPQAELLEHMARRMPELGRVFVQAESELGAINMALGAAATGAKVLVSSSSPGISLMAETMSYMAGSELPLVLINVMRGGPGLGSIGPSQSDYFQATRGHGHGDYRVPVLAPASIAEAVELVSDAFELAARYRTPVMLLADGIQGQAMEPVLPVYRRPAWDTAAWQLGGADGRPPRVLRSLHLRPEDLEAHNRAPPGEVREHRRAARCAGPRRSSRTRRSQSSPTGLLPGWHERRSHGAEPAACASGSSDRSPCGPSRPLRSSGLPSACAPSSSSSCRPGR